MRRPVERIWISLSIALALAFAGKGFANGSPAEDYFPIQTGQTYIYETLDPDENGDSRHSVVTCLARGDNTGEVGVLLMTTMYVGPGKTKNMTAFAIGGNRVMIDAIAGTLGNHEYMFRPTILQVPNPGKRIHWNDPDEMDRSVERSCLAEHIPEVKNANKVYKNVIRVTIDETVKGDPEMNCVKKVFFAKGVGLVRTEFWLHGKLQTGPVLSSQLARIENNE